jgi:hypothetical protein
MKIAKVPFNISIMSNLQQTVAGLLPVRDLGIIDNNTGDFVETGLYSNTIFGRVGTPERNKRHGYINLRCRVLHPKIFEELNRLGGLYKEIMRGKAYAKWDDKLHDFVKADILEGSTGYSFFMKHYDDIKFKRNKSNKRNLRIELINKYRAVSKIHFFIVLPAGLRDVRISEDGRPVEDDINKLYRKILITTSGIPENMAFKEDPSLDSVRWSIQNNIQAVWDTIVGTLGGKSGFLQSKWGSRRVAHGTRNVITAMDPGSDVLGSPRSFDNSTTLVGLNQTIRGIEPVITRYAMVNGIASDLITNMDNGVTLVDRKTLRSKEVLPSEKERVNWGTVQGRSDLISHFEQKENRHNPVIVEGHYLKLIYTDDVGFKLLDGIEDLPSDKDPTLVRPLTWAEYFYITTAPVMNRIRCHVTRYPITGSESTYPSVPYLKTTVTAKQLYQYNGQWAIDSDSKLFTEFPDSVAKLEFMDSASPHISSIAGLNADYDGDTISIQYVFSDESVKEVDGKLNSISNYLTTSGELHQSAGNGITKRIFHNFSGF